MIKPPAYLIAAMLGAMPLAASAAPKLAPLEDQAHCALVFAEVTRQQSNAEPRADRFPAMAKSAREFFVRTGARTLDEKAATLETIEGFYVTRLRALKDSLTKSADPAAALDREYAACLPQFAAVAPEFTPPAR
jgi:hypothetical protein